VEYRDLINPFRSLMRSERPATRSSGLRRFLESKVLPFPDRFRFVIAVGRLARPLSTWLPRSIRPMLELLPHPAKAQERTISTHAERRGRVALLTGCVQQVLEPDINAATVEVLGRNGIEVVIPPGQGCCGGLAWHTGDLALAQKFARQNVAAFPTDVEAIVTNAAGCGSTMQEYGLILKGTAEEERAKSFCKRVVDVSVFLARKGFRVPSGRSAVQRVLYQDACHLAQAQRVSNEPRSLLKAIPDLQLVELPEPHLCCGSAGTYNLDQPEIAWSLGRKKAQAILATGAQAVVSGNIGCITQLRMHLAKLGSSLPVRHTMQVLRDAYTNE
jgi:glycolate oxidase iron-sulfur subunit